MPQLLSRILQPDKANAALAKHTQRWCDTIQCSNMKVYHQPFWRKRSLLIVF